MFLKRNFSTPAAVVLLSGIAWGLCLPVSASAAEGSATSSPARNNSAASAGNIAVDTAGSSSLDTMVEPPVADDARPVQSLNDIAFGNALNEALPLRPDQIQSLISKMSSIQSAVAPAVADPQRPTPEMKVETISLDPSGTPPVIKMAAGYVTSVMLMDASGAPWPVVDMAYAGKFDVKAAAGNGHILRIIPMARFQEGNLTLQLKGLSTPVTFRLVADKDQVYFRYDVRVPAMGPFARPPRFKSANSLVAGDDVIMAVLDGVPPASARRLKVTGVDDRTAAWDVNGQTYLRTPHSLLSPAWSSSASSGDGTTVYAIQTTPVLLLSDQGVMVRARLTRPEGTTGDSSNGN